MSIVSISHENIHKFNFQMIFMNSNRDISRMQIYFLIFIFAILFNEYIYIYIYIYMDSRYKYINGRNQKDISRKLQGNK